METVVAVSGEGGEQDLVLAVVQYDGVSTGLLGTQMREEGNLRVRVMGQHEAQHRLGVCALIQTGTRTDVGGQENVRDVFVRLF
mgnify:CR=1 FL=1